MGIVQDLVNAGYGGYQGWGDSEAAADFNATGGTGKITGGGGGGGGVASPFNFDYAAEAEKAYGELGTYYNDLLQQSEGDLNLALSRLIEDYDRGVRVKTEQTQNQKENINLAQTESDRRQKIAQGTTENRIMRRGLSQTSLFAPDNNRGEIANNIVEQTNAPFEYNRITRTRNQQTLDKNLSEYSDLYGPTGVYRERKQVDTATAIDRKKKQLEQSRRTEAANIANERGSQAYNSYLANPSLV